MGEHFRNKYQHNLIKERINTCGKKIKYLTSYLHFAVQI